MPPPKGGGVSPGRPFCRIYTDGKVHFFRRTIVASLNRDLSKIPNWPRMALKKQCLSDHPNALKIYVCCAFLLGVLVSFNQTRNQRTVVVDVMFTRGRAHYIHGPRLHKWECAFAFSDMKLWKSERENYQVTVCRSYFSGNVYLHFPYPQLWLL
jgi:hypothetical protein